MNTETSYLTPDDILILDREIKAINRTLIWGVIFSSIIALVMPWLGSSKTHGKAMVDYMSYPAAVISILAVLGFIMLFYYLMTIPKLKRDLKENIKYILKTVITGKGKRMFRKTGKREYYVIVVQESPFISKEIVVTSSEYNLYGVHDNISISYAPHSKKMLSLIPSPR